MEKKRFYHVVTERPMSLNQIITFDKENGNGVFKRVKRIQKLKKREKINIDLLDKTDKMLYKDLKHWKNIANREITLENIRKKSFEKYPSRMSCLYVSQTLKDAKKWADYFIKVGRKTFQIVELESDGNCFTGDANNCWYECSSQK